MIDFAADVEPVFTDFGVSRQYMPGATGGVVPRSITVVENVKPFAPVNPAAGSLGPETGTMVRDNAITGILRSELDTGEDQIEATIEGVLQLRPIVRVIEHEPDVYMILEVR